MVLVEYEVACRSCMNADDIGHSFMFDGKLEHFYKGGILKSEHEIAQDILAILNQEEDACSHCGSYNLEISNMEIDGKALKLNPSVMVFQLFISTTASGEVAIKNGGNQYIPPGFLSDAFELIEEVIRKIPIEKFEKKNKGHIHLTVSTSYVGNTSDRENRFEKLSFAGFSEQQVEKFISIAKSHFLKK